MNLLMVTDCSFPYNSAMATRLIAFCHIFNSIGYHIHVISAKTDNKNIIYDKTIDETYYDYEIVKSKRSHKLQSYIGNENLCNSVNKYIEANKIDLVFMTGLGANFLEIYRLCRKNNLKIILEQSEWYDYSSYRFKKIDPRFIRFSINIKKNFTKVDGVIAISRLLENYYKTNDVKVIRIPTILEVTNKTTNINRHNDKRLVFTGNASKSKELLKPILQALAFDTKYTKNITFDIYGLNKQQLLSNIDNDLSLFEKVEDSIKIHGFIKQSEVKEKITCSDFQIFVRPYRQSSNAGFPTKLGESMSAGTPVITNDTGDIGLYLKDGYNGYLMSGNSYFDIVKIFDRMLSVTKEEYCEMRSNALKTANENFDYSIYVEDIKKFIGQL